MSFWYLQFSQKNKRKKNRFYYYGTSSRIVFVCFLGEFKTPKRHFEINWPWVLPPPHSILRNTGKAAGFYMSQREYVMWTLLVKSCLNLLTCKIRFFRCCWRHPCLRWYVWCLFWFRCCVHSIWKRIKTKMKPNSQKALHFLFMLYFYWVFLHDFVTE